MCTQVIQVAKKKAREFEKSTERLKMFRYECNTGGKVWKCVVVTPVQPMRTGGVQNVSCAVGDCS